MNHFEFIREVSHQRVTLYFIKLPFVNMYMYICNCICVYYVKINFKKCITMADHSTRLIVSRRSIHFECRREDKYQTLFLLFKWCHFNIQILVMSKLTFKKCISVSDKGTWYSLSSMTIFYLLVKYSINWIILFAKNYVISTSCTCSYHRHGVCQQSCIQEMKNAK